MPEPKDIFANLLANLIWYLLAAATVWVFVTARRMSSRPALRARISTRHVINAVTAMAGDLSLAGTRVRDLWRVRYQLTNKGRRPISDLAVLWGAPQSGAKIVKVDTLGSEFVADEESRRAQRPQLDPQESVNLYFYVDSRKKPALAITSTSSDGPARLETPRVPEEDVVWYIIGLFALVQALATAVSGSILFAVIGSLIAGFAFGVPGGFHMVRRWRDEGIDLP